MDKTKQMVQGTIRSGPDYATRYGNDIDVEIPEQQVNDYPGEGQARWQARRVGGQQFVHALVNSYTLLVVGGSVFEILKIEPSGADGLLLTVTSSDVDSSSAFLA